MKKPHITNNTGNNEWYTPQKYTQIAKDIMGSIDLDPASAPIANTNVKATKYYTAEQNGLLHPWKGNIWLNPPYARNLITKFTDKLIQELQLNNIIQACILVNNATETSWYQTIAKNATAIWFIKPRVHFLDKSGNPTSSPLQGQTFLYIGKNYQLLANHPIALSNGFIATNIHAK